MSEQTQAGEKAQLKELGLGLVVGFVIPVLVLAVLARFMVTSHDTASRSGPAMTEQAIGERLKPVGQVAVEGGPAPAQPAEAKPAEAATPEERIKPVGEVAVAAAPAAKAEAPAAQPKPAEKPAAPAAAEKPATPAPAAAGGTKSGPEVYKAVCAACHETGAAGAPKLGDKAAWGPRLQQGLDKLSESAIKGKGAMPPKGGAAQLSETEIALAVIFMSDKAGGAAAAPAAEKTPEKAPEKAAEKPAAAPAAAAAPAGDKGKKTYETSCAACHATGAANAPKFGDKAAWGPRIATGTPALYNSALKGKGAMPAKGGNAGLPDDDVKAAVDYMVSQAK